MRLLWVEDEIWLLYGFKERLEYENIFVETAGSFVEAKNILEKSSFDAYIVDLRLPHGDNFNNREHLTLPEQKYTGLRVVEEIRKNDRFSPIFIFSVIKDESIEKHLRKFGVTSILSKNILPSALVREILKNIQ